MRVSMLGFVFGALLVGSAMAAEVGQPAPAFSGTGADGKTYSSAELKGKYIVLEWHNQGCPYVKKHYQPGNMQRLQKDWTGKGVVWLKVLSSAAGKQGSIDAAKENEYNKTMNAAPTASILDTDQKIAKAFGAKTTPHMFVIDPKGTLIYNGALDDKSGSDPEETKTAKNYVSQALSESMGGKAVSEATTKPYGCSVKY